MLMQDLRIDPFLHAQRGQAFIFDMGTCQKSTSDPDVTKCHLVVDLKNSGTYSRGRLLEVKNLEKIHW